MGGHCGTAEGTRRREGGPSVSPLLFAGASGESWQDDASPDAFISSGGHLFCVVNLDGGVLWPFKETKLPSSPLPDGYKVNIVLGCSQKFLAKQMSLDFHRDVICSSFWVCFAQEHHTKVNANFVKM